MTKQRVLITGATSGIGLSLARRYAGENRLLLAGRRPQGEALPLIPDGAGYVSADQSEPDEAARKIVEALDTLGWKGLDLAVLNAGTGFSGDPALETPDTVRATLDTNLFAAIAFAHALRPRLEAAHGKLVLIGSAAHRGAPAFASYAASKAGLHGFARALGEEWRGRIAVQMIHPGPTATGMHERAGHDAGSVAKLFARPEAMAAMLERAISSGKSPRTISFASYARDALPRPWRKPPS